MPQSHSPGAPHEGGCLCGSVRYAATGQAKWLTNCYCRFCQRATGSTHMFEPIWEADDFVVTQGDPATYATRSEGSGKQVFVNFCPACGTKLFLRFERFPDAVGVYGGTLDHPAEAVAGVEASHIFLAEAAKGSVVPAGVNTWTRHRMSNDGEPFDPVIFDAPFVI